MQKITLYRGLTVRPDQAEMVMRDILENGLPYDKDYPRFLGSWKEIRSQLPQLKQKEDLSRDDTRPAYRMVKKGTGLWREYIDASYGFCFADLLGAQYYATKHNADQENTIPILITAEFSIEELVIDGRDFLYTVMGRIDFNDKEKYRRQKEMLTKVFGTSIEKYIDKIQQHPKSEIISIVDLAICDHAIIQDHAQNMRILGGRFGTIFRSAFFARAPILPSSILKVEVLEDLPSFPYPEIRFNDVK